MIRTLFLFISLLLLNSTVVFSQKDGDVTNPKISTNKQKKKEIKRQTKLKKALEEERLKEEKEYDSSEKAKKEDANYTPTYPVATVKVTDSIYMLKGRGGNIGLCVGPDGAFMIDDQFAEGTEAILKAISRVTDKSVQFLINTHHHGDHTGGNENLLEEGVIIFAHENVRKRLIAETAKKAQDSLEKVYNKNLEKLTKAGANEERAADGAKRMVSSLEESLMINNNLPMITFADDLTFHYNNEKILVFHVHNAHTDGDSMVYFTDSNVLHTGDVFFNGKYPFIDINNGGSFEGYLNALSKIIMLADEDTKIIPGHGEIATIKDVKYTQSMLEHLHSKVAYHYVGRKSKEQIMALKNDIMKEFDDKGYGSGYISSEKFLTFLYDDVSIKYQDKRVKQ
jgi:glyoxylase-like metal-dependent hydrolase (beta-lactamase superfamily II)